MMMMIDDDEHVYNDDNEEWDDSVSDKKGFERRQQHQNDGIFNFFVAYLISMWTMMSRTTMEIMLTIFL